MKLHQLLAVQKGAKQRAYAELTEAHKLNQKETLFNGRVRTYTPATDDGERLPTESVWVQRTAQAALDLLREKEAAGFDLDFAVEATNRNASADVVVDGKVIVPNAPATWLIHVEKRLSDIKDYIDKIPTLNPSERWSLDPNTGLYRTDVIQTTRTRKVPKVIVKYEATQHHPAQTELVQIDEIAGVWNTTQTSGALPVPVKQRMLDRVGVLLDAVRVAREKANQAEVVTADAGKLLLDFIIG